MTSTSTTVNIKLLIDKSSQKVLFAEAGKDFVDFLFGLLALSVGTVVRILSKQGMVGSIGKLYESLENLDEIYIQPNLKKEVLLKPRCSFSPTEASLLIPATADEDKDPELVTTKLYRCWTCSDFRVTYDNSNPCPGPSCLGDYMNREIECVGRKVATTEPAFSIKDGFVKDVVTYTVMDDLVVQPMSTISGIALLSKLNVKDISALEEKVVGLGIAEGLKLLRASLQCKTVLSCVFIKNCDLHDVM